MKWDGLRRSTNVLDKRGGGGKILMGGGVGGVVLAVLYVLFGGNPADVLDPGGPQDGSMGAGTRLGESAQSRNVPADDALGQFVSTVLASTEDVWKERLKETRGTYLEPKLVLFSQSVQSACGFAQAAMGPFYCPGDKRIYIDLAFYKQLRQSLGAPGDFAQAYVIAHEVGHHVQNLMGTMERAQEAKAASGSEAEANRIQVKIELQADCYAGLWANQANRENRILEQGDVEEALGAASAIGDDTLQRRSRGTIVPDAFTHGSSAQRVQWFKTGLEQGSVKECDTFAGDTRFASNPGTAF